MSVKQRILQERLSRLNQSSESLPLQSSQKLSVYRNIATIAHIDAGKTTLTERMLYMCGAIPSLGEVHHGTALMDFMEEERKRGITINSACITFSWKDTHINLIDTPGHADFNFEVERSLKVLDGALIIIDGVKGVEAQTEIVWKQADNYNLAKLLVINKMDRAGAEYDKSIESVENQIGTKVIPAFFPLLRKDKFLGVVDILGNKIYFWQNKNSYGSVESSQTGNVKFDYTSEEKNQKDQLADQLKYNLADHNKESEELNYYEEELNYNTLSDQDKNLYTKCVERMIELVSEKFEQALDEYLNAISKSPVLNKDFLSKLKHYCKSIAHDHPKDYCISIPCSALKNKGIQSVLDSVLEYLPAPTDQFANSKEPFIFVFKTIIESTYGFMAFAKIMAGRLNRAQVLFNTSSSSETKTGKIYRIRANEYAEIDSVGAGDIVAITGLTSVKAGENLIQPGSLKMYSSHLVKGFELKEPLYHASLEFEKNSDKDKFVKIIDNYLLEDPSLRYKLDKETGQYILSGLGELHIETKLDRIKNEHNLKLSVGKINVAFKEILGGSAEKVTTTIRKVKGLWKYFELHLIAEPLEFDEGEEFQDPIVEVKLFDHDPEAKKLYEQYVDGMEEVLPTKLSKNKKIVNDDDTGFAEQGPTNQKLSKNLLTKMSFIKNPLPLKISKRDYKFDDDNIYDLNYLRCLDFEFIYSIQKSLREMAERGPLMYSPLVNTKISIVGGQFCRDLFDPVIMKMTTVDAFNELLLKENMTLLEPTVEVHVTSKNDYVNEIINNAISKRGGKMGLIESADIKNTTFTIEIPLISSSNYSSYIRSLTSGDAKFTIRNKGYARTKLQRQQFLCANY